MEHKDLIELIGLYIDGAERGMEEGERVRLRAEGAKTALTQLKTDLEQRAAEDDNEQSEDV